MVLPAGVHGAVGQGPRAAADRAARADRGAVLEHVAAAAERLRLWSGNPDMRSAADAAQKLEWMRHLCAVCAEWTVRVDLVEVVSYFELAEGAIDGVIKPELAVSVARERSGSEKDVRAMLRFAREWVEFDRNGGGKKTSRGLRWAVVWQDGLGGEQVELLAAPR